MLHNEARELLVKYYEKSGDVKATAAAYSVSEWTVYRLAKQKRETGSVALRTSQRGRKPSLTEEDKKNIRQSMDETPDSTVGEIQEKLELTVSRSTAVGELLAAHGVTPVYLPPYSPDLNPIEKMWSKMKAILRAWKIRSPDELPDAVAQALELVTTLDCQHWFN